MPLGAGFLMPRKGPERTPDTGKVNTMGNTSNSADQEAPEVKNADPASEGGAADGQGTTELHEHGDTAEGTETVEQLTADRDKWKAWARKHEERAKANAAAAQEWAKHQESTKTEEQKTTERAESLMKERDTALAEAAVLRAAVKHNLSQEDLELLEGLPVDVIEERAAKLASRVHKQPTRTPDPNLGRETPPGQSPQSGDFLSNAFNRR